MSIKFDLTSFERVRATKWIKEHECHLKDNPTAIGGRISYIFTPTGLGTVVQVACVCGESKTISDDF